MSPFEFTPYTSIRERYSWFKDIVNEIPLQAGKDATKRLLVPSDAHFKIFDILSYGFTQHKTKASAVRWKEFIATLLPYKLGYHVLDIQAEAVGDSLEWSIASALTPRGLKAQEALKKGQVWDMNFHEVADVETRIFLKEIQRMSGIPEILLGLDYEDLSMRRAMFNLKLKGYSASGWIYQSEEAYHVGQYSANWFTNVLHA